jgi:signal transduction histidine kinase
MSNKPIKILLVEDNPGDARLLQEALMEAGPAQFELVPVEQLSEALQGLSEKGFDVILLDLSLPDSQGFDTFARAHVQAPGVPIVVLTGLNDEALAIKAVQEGAQDYLVKGQVDSNLLVRAIRYAIERKRVEKELERQRADFLAMLTHDIKNPLGVVLGCADMLREGEGLSPQQEDLVYCQEISTRMVLSLVNNYLDFSKIEAGHLTLAKKPLEVNHLLRRMGQQYETEAQRRQITLEFRLQPELPAVEGDALALERVFANLVHNALNFTPKLGQVIISSRWQSSEVVAMVADTGPGIAPEEVSFIFDKYRQAASGWSRGGVGLGLFIVKALVEAHGGRVEVKSTPGQGTCFLVFLPAQAV